jgi:hypothetical protein
MTSYAQTGLHILRKTLISCATSDDVQEIINGIDSESDLIRGEIHEITGALSRGTAMDKATAQRLTKLSGTLVHLKLLRKNADQRLNVLLVSACR